VRASSSAGTRPGRLGALDALRFVAALSVVAFHFTGITVAWPGRAPGEVDGLGRWAAYGAMGVPLFFVISGFVVLMTAWGRDVPHFVASRVGRLFPAYWAAVLLAMVFAFAIWPAGSIQDGRGPSKVDALVNLSMLQGAFGVPDLDGAFWTLWTEARFYVLLAVFILVGITRRRVLAFAALWPVVGALVARLDEPLFSTLLISDYSPYFAGGMLLYLIYRDGHDLVTWLLVGLQAVFALRFALGYYPGALTVATGWPVSKAMVTLISLACFGLVALVTLTRLNTRAARWMTFLGALTYPVYLVHEKIGFFVIHITRNHVSPWVALGAAVVAALSVATALHYAVERRWGSRLRAATLHGLQSTASVPTVTRARKHAALPEHRLDEATASVTSPLAAVPTVTVHDSSRRRSRDVRVPIPAAAGD
jgi:peptidoglycan/LPS O-acetylase OafA/YrhL